MDMSYILCFASDGKLEQGESQSGIVGLRTDQRHKDESTRHVSIFALLLLWEIV